MKRSISIINTEIQLINVIEAIHHFKCEENYLVIGQFNIRPERIQKIEKMLEEPLFKQHFKKIIHLPLYLSNKNPLRFLGYILAYIKFFFLILFSKKFDFCFFGVVTDIIVKPIVYLTQYKNPYCVLCVVDEGARVIMDSNNRVQNEALLLRQQNKRIQLFYGLYLAITRKWIYPALTYFSIYQLSLLKQDVFIRNEYIYFKHNKIQQILLKEPAIVIAGQPMSELKITTSNTYQQIIQKIIAKYKQSNIYYAPHPIETEYKQWLPSNVHPLQTQYPLEIILLVNQVDTLIGFYSTVLSNSAIMRTCQEIYSISLKTSEYLSPPEPNMMNRINDQFEQVGVQIINTNLCKPNQ